MLSTVKYMTPAPMTLVLYTTHTHKFADNRLRCYYCLRYADNNRWDFWDLIAVGSVACSGGFGDWGRAYFKLLHISRGLSERYRHKSYALIVMLRGASSMILCGTTACMTDIC
eukprot:1750-Heterococcus_DN1.PRE.5